MGDVLKLSAQMNEWINLCISALAFSAIIGGYRDFRIGQELDFERELRSANLYPMETSNLIQVS